jgi:guanylate kinase
MTHGVILYGPPAAGKDTITRALRDLDDSYVLFPRLKIGEGRTAGYRMTTPEAVDQLRADGEIVWENCRYGACYIVDMPSLELGLREHVPVVHLGQSAGIDAVTRATPAARWLRVYLWCPRDVAAQRIKARRTGDSDERLRAWDETEPLSAFDLKVDTATVHPEAAAAAIHELVRSVQGVG